MKKLTNEMHELALEINRLLKDNSLVKEYNELYDFLMKNNEFKSAQKDLINNKNLLRTGQNYAENKRTFLITKKQFDDNFTYKNYLNIKEDLNNLFNEISSILTIK